MATVFCALQLRSDAAVLAYGTSTAAAISNMFANVVAGIVAAQATGDAAKRSYVWPTVLIGAALALPVLALLLSILRGLTAGNPLKHEPLLGLSVDSAIGGLILAAEMVRRTRKSTEARLQSLATLEAGARRQFQLRWLAIALVLAAVLQLAAATVIWR
jgi:hypothetical protein